MNMRTRLINNPLHLFFLPLLFVLNHFFSITQPTDGRLDHMGLKMVFNFFGAVALCTLISVVIYVLLSRYLSKDKGALIATILIFPFFFFQDFFLSTEEMLVGIRLRWIVPIMVFALLLLVIWVIKRKQPFYHANEVLNTISFALVIYVVGVLYFSFDRLKPKSFEFDPPPHALDCKPCPDIYFLVLDSYTSNKSLRDFFHFDNRKFIKILDSLDFVVSDQVHSRFDLTKYSLASLLNMNRLKDPDRYQNDYGVKTLIQSNLLVKSLKARNYKIKNISLFDIDDQKKYYSLEPSVGVDFIDGIIQSSVLNLILNFFEQDMYQLHYQVLEEFRSGVHEPSPLFTYAHVMAPHPPFVLDSIGGRIGFLSLKRNRVNAQSYVEQIKGLNKLVTETLQAIIRNSPGSAIVIAGDHGYRFIGSQDEGFTVFLAYRGPNSNAIGQLRFSDDIFKFVIESLNQEN